MPNSRRSGNTLVLSDETWRERIERAWRRQGESARTLAPALGSSIRVSHKTLSGWLDRYPFDLADPVGLRATQAIGLILAALGYDPADFGLPVDGHLIYMQPAVVAAVAANIADLHKVRNTCFVTYAGQVAA
jgi:hypothetical protein